MESEKSRLRPKRKRTVTEMHYEPADDLTIEVWVFLFFELFSNFFSDFFCSVKLAHGSSHNFMKQAKISDIIVDQCLEKLSLPARIPKPQQEWVYLELKFLMHELCRIKMLV